MSSSSILIGVPTVRNGLVGLLPSGRGRGNRRSKRGGGCFPRLTHVPSGPVLVKCLTPSHC